MASQDFKDKYRLWVKDYAAQNILEQIQESSDTYLEMAFDDALDEANYTIGPILETMWTLDTFPSFAILKFGVLYQVMLGMSDHSARNSVSYTDSAGINVREKDLYIKYDQLLNRVERKWEVGVTRLKTKANFDAGWGSLPSEYYI